MPYWKQLLVKKNWQLFVYFYKLYSVIICHSSQTLYGKCLQIDGQSPVKQPS